MNARQVQYLRGIEIADAGNRALIQQSDLDRSAALSQSQRQVIGGQRQCVRTKLAVTELGRELSFAEQSHRAQPAAVPVPDVPNWSIRQVEPKAQVLLRRWIGYQHQPSHSRLEDQAIATFHPEHYPFTEP